MTSRCRLLRFLRPSSPFASLNRHLRELQSVLSSICTLFHLFVESKLVLSISPSTSSLIWNLPWHFLALLAISTSQCWITSMSRSLGLTPRWICGSFPESDHITTCPSDPFFRNTGRHIWLFPGLTLCADSVLDFTLPNSLDPFPTHTSELRLNTAEMFHTHQRTVNLCRPDGLPHNATNGGL